MEWEEREDHMAAMQRMHTMRQQRAPASHHLGSVSHQQDWQGHTPERITDQMADMQEMYKGTVYAGEYEDHMADMHRMTARTPRSPSATCNDKQHAPHDLGVGAPHEHTPDRLARQPPGPGDADGTLTTYYNIALHC